jgi:multidrug efflux pump subunit AcrA (membrane-fusion protein)
MIPRFSGKVVALSALILFLLYVGYRIYETKSDAAALQAKTTENAIPTVAIVHPKPGEASETITLPGNITAWFEAPIYAQVSGYVKMWYKDYGAQVKKGDILAEINAPALDAQYAQAKADLDSERAKYALADITAKRWVAPSQSSGVRTIHFSESRGSESRGGEGQGVRAECSELRGPDPVQNDRRAV